MNPWEDWRLPVSIVVSIALTIIVLIVSLAYNSAHKREMVADATTYEEMILLYGGNAHDITVRLSLRGIAPEKGGGSPLSAPGGD